jgi:aerobic carbon-monoxide dehydrogenase small subunit
MNGATAGKCQLSFTVNQRQETLRAFPMERLLDVLRNHLGLTGTKEGCSEGECGSCSVLMNGKVVNSCLIPVLQAQGACITTIEGIQDGTRLSEIQSAFLECGGAQCGICTPAMLLCAEYLLQTNPAPTLDEIRDALAGNLCRCTGYMQIFEAVQRAARHRTQA